MIITGSVLLVAPGTNCSVVEALQGFPNVTAHAQSESGSEIVITIEAEDHDFLERLCQELRETITEIIEISHVYMNFEEEIEFEAALRANARI